MRKKIIFPGIWALLIFSGLFFARNILAKNILLGFLNKNISADCSFGSINLTLNNIYFEDFYLDSPGLTVRIDKGRLRPYFSRFSRIAFWEIVGTRGQVAIKKVSQLDIIKKTGLALAVGPAPIQLDLKNILISLQDRVLPQVRGEFSFTGMVKSPQMVSVDNLTVKDLSLEYKDILINGIDLVRWADGYVLKVGLIALKNKKIIGSKAYLSFDGHKVVLEKAVSELFGDNGYIQGSLVSADYKNFILSLEAKDIALDKVSHFFDENDEVVARGRLSGFLNVFFSGKKIRDVSGSFNAFYGGYINIKNDAPFRFLRTYLKKESYNLLIAAFKNYKYNRGKALMKSEGGGLIINMGFESAVQGNRDIEIFLHRLDILAPLEI